MSKLANEKMRKLENE